MQKGFKNKIKYTPANSQSKKLKIDLDDDFDDSPVFSTFEQELANLGEKDEEYVPVTDVKMPFNGIINSKWIRPSFANINPQSDSLTFQQIDIDFYTGPAYTNQSSDTPIIRMYGSNDQGNSITCHVHGYYPYFYVNMPKDFNPTNLSKFRISFNETLMSESKLKANLHKFVIDMEIVDKQNIYGYHGGKLDKFIKVTLAIPKLVPTARRILEHNFPTPYTSHAIFQTYESNLDYEIKYMVDSNISGGNWIEIPPGTYTIRGQDGDNKPIHSSSSVENIFSQPKSTKIALDDDLTLDDFNTDMNDPYNSKFKTSQKPITRCQIEIDVPDWRTLIPHSHNDPSWSHIAPCRILSFDIECSNRKGIFPDPFQDSVIQIANMVMRHGEQTPFIRNIFTLNTCAPIIGSDVYCFDNEAELLEKWAEFVRQVDPDIITGYNIQNFDFPYLINRATALKAANFFYLGRVTYQKTGFKESTIQSKQMGRRENKLIAMEGRIIFDLFQIVVREHKLRSYSLNAVSFHFLEEQKEDVQHSIITDLQNGNEQTRRRLAVYCMKDAYLPLRLINKLLCLINYIEMARVTGVPINYLLTRGQQIKVLTQLLKKAKEKNLILPAYQGESGEEYTGATVIEPVKGYYDTPIATLDFSSLYPSIMIAHNLCYSTLVLQDKYGVSLEDITTTPSNNHFVKSTVFMGVLPEILTDLMAARKKVKAELKSETDIFKKQVLDGRQLAIKISANSVYGFTGAQVGKLPCLEISQSVTAYGRVMIEQTKIVVEEHFTIANGFKHDAKVIYGDTDSVMIKFNIPSLEETMELGRQVAEYVSKHFPSPIKLEFEKVYFPYLLINKKRYAGLCYTRPEKHDKLDCKGLETVRRDNCPLVSNLITSCLNKTLIERDPKSAIDHAIQVISDLLCNKIVISQLVVTKELTKTDKEYAGKQAHVELAAKMKKRDAGSAPSLGDRIPFIITAGAKGSAAYARAEDPIYVLENNIPLDTQYYLDNQISKPLLRVFEPILGDKAESILLRGKHTLTKSVTISKTGSLSQYTTKQATCLNCKTILGTSSSQSGSKVVCKHCLPVIAEVCQREILKLNELEQKFSELWTQCQRCSGSFHEDVLCTNQDCPIYYMRKKVQMDIGNQNEVVLKFE